MFIPKRLVITSAGRAIVPSSVRVLVALYIQNDREAVALSYYEIENDRQIVMHIA
jgi:hypothetical protein